MIEIKAAVGARYGIDSCHEMLLRAFKETHLDIVRNEPTRILAREPYMGSRENTGLITVEAKLRQADALATRIDLTATTGMSGPIATLFAEHRVEGILHFLGARIQSVRLTQ